MLRSAANDSEYPADADLLPSIGGLPALGGGRGWVPVIGRHSLVSTRFADPPCPNLASLWVRFGQNRPVFDTKHPSSTPKMGSVWSTEPNPNFSEIFMAKHLRIFQLGSFGRNTLLYRKPTPTIPRIDGGDATPQASHQGEPSGSELPFPPPDPAQLSHRRSPNFPTRMSNNRRDHTTAASSRPAQNINFR